MTTLIEICGQPAVHALGWTLLHLCWQGALVAVVLWCVLEVLGGRSSQMRYAVSCVALGLMVALPVATFAHLAADEYRMRAAFDGSAVVIDTGMVLQVSAGGMTEPWPVRMSDALDRAMPWILLAWLAGVIVFVGRLNVGLLVARRLRTMATSAVPAELQQMFDAMRRRLGVGRAVRLMHSALVQVPTVIGWLRPVVLIPASCLTGLSTMQIEAILAHELAHIRRHDYLVSVLQSVIETLLFYHPAVWWVSRQIRRERECCCDEMAVAVGGDRLAYARALSVLEERRACMPEFVLGANGGVLTMRIKRLLGCGGASKSSQLAAGTVLAILVVVAGSYVVTAARAEVNAMSRAAHVTSPMELEPATPLNALIALPAGREFRLREPFLMAQAEAQAAPRSDGMAALPPEEQEVERQLHDLAAKIGPEYQKQLDEVLAANAKINTPEFRKQVDAAMSPELKKELANATAKAQAASAKFAEEIRQVYANLNSPEFKKQMADAQAKYAEEIRQLDAKLNSPEFKKQMADAEAKAASADSPEFKKQRDDAMKAMEKVNTPEYRKQMEELLAQQMAMAQGSAGAEAQANARATQGEGTIAGSIVDPTGAAVPHAKVTSVNTDNGKQTSSETDNSGKYSLSGLQAGPYNVEVVAKGFQRMLQENVHVDSGKTVGLNLKLTVGTVSQSLTVTVNNASRHNGQPNPTFTGTVSGLHNGDTVTVTYSTTATQFSPAGNYPITATVSGAHIANYAVTVVPGMLTITKEGTVDQVNAISGPLRVSAGVMAGNLIYKADPVYPTDAKAAHVQGAVILHAFISKDGTIERLEVISGNGMLVNAAKDAVQQWKYKPYLLNGQPTEVETTITVNFSLADSTAQGAIPAGDAVDGVKKVGGDVKGPVVIYQPEPEYTERARKDMVNGVITVSLVVDEQGRPTNLKASGGRLLSRHADSSDPFDGLDEKAVEAVKKYKFKPATENGKPVAVYLNVEINFALF